ncbi:hypothetical protein Saro_3495 (plasmid) [Novosphingobium aromaticivorans DSM 12444]|uniref:HTH marR-type domain-containing protein n=1 Tax=Novosphingobium aromaticivorans (strain ATCC 700278 / DSM 12444 / CCUG 56034 / CIP 105152 / NBRC 16084 / F199) TaxID=279238 RepID=A4XEJ4_NOVAD|nr:hypothetical protein [Novosphingobium aromaticivorans]ABP64355.1 hypothetical protein Saro_3495 [Novosphingobium aromaticivorans DSM 12444]SCY82035.1 hypothetical protein SAMN05660666_03084 [Novosphingobium aromaticivorans]
MKEPAKAEVLSFIGATFRSAWSLDLLCLLRTEPRRAWTQAELVRALCASDLVVRQSLDELSAAGLVLTETEGAVRYGAAPGLELMVVAVEKQYRTAPATVRRAIVKGNSPTITAFADAFKLRSEE